MTLVEFVIVSFLATTFELTGFTEKELTCTAINVWHEARGEDRIGLIMAAQTVRNRVKSPKYPSDACKVIYQTGQFEWTEDGYSDKVHLKRLEDVDKFREIVEYSAMALAGNFDGIVEGSTHYFNAAKVIPCWHGAFDMYLVHGNHRWGLEPNGSTPCWDKAMASIR